MVFLKLLVVQLIIKSSIFYELQSVALVYTSPYLFCYKVILHVIVVVFYFFQEFMPVLEERWRGKSQNFPSCEKLQGNLSCSSNKDGTSDTE